LRNDLVNTHAFKVIERNRMNEVLKEQGFQNTGCTSQECAVEVGQLIGVNKMIAGSIGKVGRTYLLSVRLIDVATGEILNTVEEQVKGEIDDMLSSGVGNVARKLAYSVTAKAPEKNTGKENPVERPAKKYGSLRIESRPSEAQLSLDDSISGKTPFVNNQLSTGVHALKIELPGYVPITDRISIEGAKVTHKVYALEHTQAWRDSVKLAEKSSNIPFKYQYAAGASYAMTIGKINTMGVALSFGTKAQDFCLGIQGSYSSGQGNNDSGVQTKRTFAGGGLFAYYEKLNAGDVLKFEPGITGGFWQIADQTNAISQNYYFFGGPAIKLQIGYKYIFLTDELTALFNLSMVSIRNNAGVQVLF
ncbi:MAG: CsgG/HfaB family protein, partial [Chitinivibrionales bacterium]|nr:CsgG/HfaB family protein [Chitinivibrionales bacterium]